MAADAISKVKVFVKDKNNSGKDIGDSFTSWHIPGFGFVDNYCSDMEWVHALSQVMVNKAASFTEYSIQTSEISGERLAEIDYIVNLLKEVNNA